MGSIGTRQSSAARAALWRGVPARPIESRLLLKHTVPLGCAPLSLSQFHGPRIARHGSRPDDETTAAKAGRRLLSAGRAAPAEAASGQGLYPCTRDTEGRAVRQQRLRQEEAGRVSKTHGHGRERTRRRSLRRRPCPARSARETPTRTRPQSPCGRPDCEWPWPLEQATASAHSFVHSTDAIGERCCGQEAAAEGHLQTARPRSCPTPFAQLGSGPSSPAASFVAPPPPAWLSPPNRPPNQPLSLSAPPSDTAASAPRASCLHRTPRGWLEPVRHVCPLNHNPR